jgi:rubrerythrin
VDTARQAEELARLRFLDQIEITLLQEAAAKVADPELSAQLEQARADHERHLHELDALFGECGDFEEPDVPETFRAAAYRRLDDVRQVHDQADVVRAVLAAERDEAKAYAAVAAQHLPGDEDSTVRAQMGDEERHIEALSRGLEQIL